MKNEIKIFEQNNIRSVYDEENEKQSTLWLDNNRLNGKLRSEATKCSQI